MALRAVDAISLSRNQRDSLRQNGPHVQLLVDPQHNDYFLKGNPDAAPILLPKIGNEDIPFKSLENRIDFSAINAPDSAELARICDQAVKSRAASVTCTPQQLPTVVNALGQQLVKICCVLPQASAADAAAAVKAGADEVTIPMDRQALLAGNKDAIKQQIADVVKAVNGLAVKVLVPTKGLDETPIALGAHLAEEAGATYVGNLDPQWVAAPIFHESCRLALQLTGNLHTLGQCASLVQRYPDRHIRFLTDAAPHIVRQDQKHVSTQLRKDNAVLRENLLKPSGVAAVQQAEAFKQQLLAQIDAAHQEGKPVVYLSICVRPNDVVGSKAQSEALREQLIETCQRAGVACIDPFQAEPLPFLHDPKVDGTVIQELLMDVNAGVWPAAMQKCDAILHGPHWKYSVGASQEDLIANRIGLPAWDGHSPIPLR